MKIIKASEVENEKCFMYGDNVCKKVSREWLKKLMPKLAHIFTDNHVHGLIAGTKDIEYEVVDADVDVKVGKEIQHLYNARVLGRAVIENERLKK